jgi:hypothetical protein
VISFTGNCPTCSTNSPRRGTRCVTSRRNRRNRMRLSATRQRAFSSAVCPPLSNQHFAAGQTLTQLFVSINVRKRDALDAPAVPTEAEAKLEPRRYHLHPPQNIGAHGTRRQAQHVGAYIERNVRLVLLLGWSLTPFFDAGIARRCAK